MPTIYMGAISKRRNSTLQPTLSSSYDCILKQPVSIDNPVFIIQDASFNMALNYAKWENTYYFVDRIVSVRNNVWEVSCSIDVLATYKSEIIGSTQYVCYSSLSGGTWLADTRIPVLKDTVASKAVASLPFIDTNGFYVLSVVGGDTGVGGCEIFAVNKSTLNALIQSISTWESSDVADIMLPVGYTTPTYNSPTVTTPTSDDRHVCFTALIDALKNMLDSFGNLSNDIQSAIADLNIKIQEASSKTGFLGNAYANAPECIRSCIWVPFDLSSFTGNAGSIYLGKYDTGQGGFKVNPTPTASSVTVSIPWHFSDWRRGYCEDVYLYLPFVGMVAYSANSLTNVSTLTVKYSVTATDGNICYQVIAGDEILGTYGGNAATNYPIGVTQQASAGEMFTALVGGVQKTVAAAVNSSLSPMSTVAAVGSMALEMGIATYDVANTQATTHFSCIGGIGGGAGCGLDLDITCYTVAHNTVVAPNDMKDTMGVPTMQPTLLSTLTGYCQCANAHVAAPAMAPELDAIDAFLNSGFYIE